MVSKERVKMRIKPSMKSEYAYFKKMTTRWRDNDVYGHMNNVVFYEFADTIVNEWLQTNGGLDIPNGTIIGLVVETTCTYFSELGFPKSVNSGLKVVKVGNTSVSYEVGLFNGEDENTAARIKFVHVYVDIKTRKPTALPQSLKNSLNSITLKS